MHHTISKQLGWLSDYTVLWVILETLKIESLSLLPLYQESNEAPQIIGMEFKVP